VKKRKPWQTQEKRIGREGARRVPGSGSGPLKGDNKGEMFLIQAKTTEKRQYSLRVADLRKMILDANIEERIALMQVEFNSFGDERYAVLRWDDFAAILEDFGVVI